MWKKWKIFGRLTENVLPSLMIKVYKNVYGKIGSYFAKYASEKYYVRVVDKDAWDIKKHGPLPGESLVFDLSYLDECRSACEGVDIVIHLAADASQDADFVDSLMDNNTVAVYNMFRASRDSGVKRFIFTSSAHVVSAYDAGIQINLEMAVRPGNMYGVAKGFGEVLAAYFAYKEGLPCIVLRIGAYTFPGEYVHFSSDEMDAFLDPDDFNELLIRCIETPDIEFAIAHAISDNLYKRLDLSQTREIFGYQPKTDAFTIFQKPENGL